MAAHRLKAGLIDIVSDKHRVEHPDTGYARSVSENVEQLKTEYSAFQGNLRNLVLLYKTRHQLLESINENGLYTAKCFNEMYGGYGCPLASIVVPGRKKASVVDIPDEPVDSIAEIAPSPTKGASFEEDQFVASKSSSSKLNDDVGVMGPGEARDEFRGANVLREPDGIVSPRQKSIHASAPNMDSFVEKADRSGRASDPPTANSVKDETMEDETMASKENVRGSCDPPSAHAEFPDDEMGASVERGDTGSSMAVNHMESVNIIVDDDDDSFTAEILGEGGAAETTKAIDPEETEKDQDEIEAFRGNDDSFQEIAKDTKDTDEGRQSLPKEPDSNVPSEDATSSLEPRTESEYLNLSNEGEVLVVPLNESDDIRTPSAPTLKDIEDSTRGAIVPAKEASTYYDVNKQAFKASNTRLARLKELVEYVTEWADIVSHHISAKYSEYHKLRQSLNHYNRKMEALLAEEQRLKEKGKEMKPKQIEKLKRNEDKLDSARDTHDESGESLCMFIDEVVHRSWVDAWPLLQKTIDFECDFEESRAAIFSKLESTSQLAEAIGIKQRLDVEGRLQKIDCQDVDELYSGTIVWRKEPK